MQSLKRRFEFNLLPVLPGWPAVPPATEKMFQDGVLRHLIGEAEQNSVDASALQCGGQRARLRYTLAEIDRERLLPYGLETAENHARACNELKFKEPADSPKVRVLRMEDWSGGLPGKVTAQSNDVTSALGRYLFAVGTGINGKGGRSNGRHGLGSATGALASMVRAMLVASRRQDGTIVASGRLSQPSHYIDDRQYAADVRLGVLDEDGKWMGILQDEEAEKMSDDLGFDREEAGLSCAILWPDESITYASIVLTIIVQQVYQIMKGLIEYEVRDEETGVSCLLNKETLVEYMDSADFLALTDSRPKARGRRPKYDPVARARDIIAFMTKLPPMDEVVTVEDLSKENLSDELRLRYLNGHVIGVRVPRKEFNTEKGEAEGYLYCYMEKRAEGAPGFSLRVRDAIANISEATGVNSLVLAENDGVAEALGDCEDAAHTEYKTANARPRGWPDLKPLIDLYKSLPARLQQSLAAFQAEKDMRTFGKYFPRVGKEFTGRVPAGSKDEISDGVVIVNEGKMSKPLVHSFNALQGTLKFRLSSNARKAVDRGELTELRFRIDYAHTKRGMGTFTDSMSNISIVDGYGDYSRRDDVFTISGLRPEFQIEIRNVDKNRDIEIVYLGVTDQEEEAA